MNCPVCGANKWVRVQKKVRPVPISTATKTVIIYKCANCGYEKPSPDE